MRGILYAALPTLKLKIAQVLDRLSLLVPACTLLIVARALSPVVLVRNLRVRLQGVADGWPMPPERLIGYVISRPDLRTFLDDGEATAKLMRHLLEANGLTKKRLKILDFGCGCGRVIRHVKDLGELHGCDYNPALVDWCRGNLPLASFQMNRLEPPTNYSDGTFDFIYAISVFTHLTENPQVSWINELRRILRPEGHLLITTRGESGLAVVSRDERRLFKSGRLVVRWGKYQGTNICAAFHPKQYLVDTLAKGFLLVDMLPSALPGPSRQDIYLLRKTR